QAEEELREGCARQALQLQELGRRERLAREQLESFKARVMRVCSPAAAGEALTEQQVIGKVREISEENQQSHQREKHLQEELSSRLLKEKEMAANLEVLEKSLQELQ
ncbi:Forkhead-associated domain-containing protein 1, partial [Merops nubicus]